MGALLDAMNTADRLARQWRHGLTPGVIVADMLGDLGFTAIDIGERSIVARFNGVRFDLDGTAGPLFNQERN